MSTVRVCRASTANDITHGRYFAVPSPTSLRLFGLGFFSFFCFSKKETANGWMRDLVGQAGRQVMACMHAPRAGLKESWLGANTKSKEVEGEAHGLAWLGFALRPLDCLPDRDGKRLANAMGHGMRLVLAASVILRSHLDMAEVARSLPALPTYLVQSTNYSDRLHT
ncbi:uncharacterized protein J3D65DRAFT_422492 [Phyllosticta citribraziliensis]|uniref:Uncharacterized protein n=1 Tax=Phyllosticta citribraziliensis TaxID=989973 RepID=A0ABR1LJP6_9PEZI